MPYRSRYINQYPPPIYSQAEIETPDPIVDVCGALIVITASVSDPEVHSFVWEQITGPTVDFNVSSDGLTLSFIREQTVDHVFRLYVDRYTSVEVSEDYTVTDTIQSNLTANIAPTLSPLLHQNSITSDELLIGVEAVDNNGEYISGEQPARVWFTFGNSPSFNKPFIQYVLYTEQGIPVYIDTEVLGLHRTIQPAGRYYVEAQFYGGGVVRSRTVQLSTRNINTFGKHIRSNLLVDYTKVNSNITSPIVVRDILGSVKKLITDTLSSDYAKVSGVSSSFVKTSYSAITCDTITDTLATSVVTTKPIAASVVATRLNGGNIGG
jgi:hypothetical protein